MGIRTIAARRHSQSGNFDTIDTSRRIFLDVGYWGGNYEGNARTDFGLVSGKFVVLCSWLNMDGKGQNPTDEIDYPKPIKSILEARQDRGFVLGHTTSHSELSGSNQLTLFLPDLHLNLFRLTKCDNFKYNRYFQIKHAKPIIDSLEKELSDLLDLAEAVDAEIIQTGDCFEMWEAQAHLISDHQELGKARESINNILPSSHLRKPWEKMWREHKIISRNDYEHTIVDFEHLLKEPQMHGIKKKLTNTDVDRLGLEFEDQDVVKNAIMAKYPLIFKGNRYGPNMRFLWVRGNHDNMLTNYHYGKEYYIASAIEQPRAVFCLARMWVEHGHETDKSNRDENFCDGSWSGFGITKNYTLGHKAEGGYGILFGPIGEQTEHEGEIARSMADLFAPMRPDQLRRVETIFFNHKNVRLVVMGHTHSPLLLHFDEYIAEKERLEQQNEKERKQMRIDTSWIKAGYF